MDDRAERAVSVRPRGWCAIASTLAAAADNQKRRRRSDRPALWSIRHIPLRCGLFLFWPVQAMTAWGVTGWKRKAGAPLYRLADKLRREIRDRGMMARQDRRVARTRAAFDRSVQPSRAGTGGRGKYPSCRHRRPGPGRPLDLLRPLFGRRGRSTSRRWRGCSRWLADAAAGEGDVKPRWPACSLHFWDNRKRARESFSGRMGEKAARLLADLVEARLELRGVPTATLAAWPRSSSLRRRWRRCGPG